jgi:hypothetical protein
LTLIALASVVLLISLDALRVLPDVPGWRQPNMDAYYSRMGWPPYRATGRSRLAASGIFRNIPTSRPPRTTPIGLVRWRGYVDGRYVTTDLTPNVLRATRLVDSNRLYQRYMLMEWSPLLLDARQAQRGTPHVVLPESEISDGLATTTAIDAGSVKQTRYGVNDIVYQVSLSQPRLLVENEMYFPGWQARLSKPDARTIQAAAVNGVFRSWLLPQGDYTMEAHFVFPYLLGLRPWHRFCCGCPSCSYDGRELAGVSRQCPFRNVSASLMAAYLSRAFAFTTRHPRATSFVGMSSLLLAYTLSADDMAMYGDAGGYWSAARLFATAHGFSLHGYVERHSPSTRVPSSCSGSCPHSPAPRCSRSPCRLSSRMC